MGWSNAGFVKSNNPATLNCRNAPLREAMTASLHSLTSAEAAIVEEAMNILRAQFGNGR